LTAAGLAELAESVLRWQRELFVVGAELATNPDRADSFRDGVTRVSEQMLDDVERELGRFEAGIEMPREFIVPGETRSSAAIELARAVLRRGERRIVALKFESGWVGAYVNRLADLLWVLARAAEAAEKTAPTRVRK
jgi:cob(I)alamin adenosyltransferase